MQCYEGNFFWSSWRDVESTFDFFSIMVFDSNFLIFRFWSLQAFLMFLSNFFFVCILSLFQVIFILADCAHFVFWFVFKIKRMQNQESQLVGITIHKDQVSKPHKNRPMKLKSPRQGLFYSLTARLYTPHT